MSPKILAAGLLVGGSLVGAAGGAYLASRQPSSAASPAAAPAVVQAPQPPVEVVPVQDTETVLPVQLPEAREPEERPDARATVPPPMKAQEARRPVQPRRPSNQAQAEAAGQGVSAAAQSPAQPAAALPEIPLRDLPAVSPTVDPPAEQPVTREVPAAGQVRQFDELVVPASAVIGVQVETAVSSERARVEDRVEARVTRDVVADGTVAVPAGSRVLGTVTEVERGGKMRERARLAVRFHTLVLGDGRQVALRSEAISREGDSPAGESARKIGGAAIGGAILGGLLGGGKGAAVGSAVGAAGGSAAVMAGGRNPATLPAGTVVTLRLSAPLTIEVEKR